VLARALPELGAAVERRQAANELDPLSTLHWSTLTRLQGTPTARNSPHRERLLLAALVLDATDTDTTPPVVVARKTCQRLDVGAATEQAVASLVIDAGLLGAAIRRIDGLGEEAVLQIAAHLGTVEHTRALVSLTEARTVLDPDDRGRLDTLHRLIETVLRQPELVGREATNTLEQRRAHAERLVHDDPNARRRIQHAPRAYLLRAAPTDVARQTRLCDPIPHAGTVRVSVTPNGDATGPWHVDVTTRDRPGVLARETGVLAAHGIDIDDALAATWSDGCALASFVVRSDTPPDPHTLRSHINDALARPLTSRHLVDAILDFDDDASPWHSICTARAPDSRGLLFALTTAFAAAHANVHAAHVRADGITVIGVFELTDNKGRKLPSPTRDRIRELLSTGVIERPSRWRLFGRRGLHARQPNATITQPPP
jgi:UTP:GlnB (protein PII) uridylyltransferase